MGKDDVIEIEITTPYVETKMVDSFEESEKLQIKKDLLKYIEKNIGYDRKYIINCLKKNKINYATATYYLMSKDEIFNSKK